MIEIEFDLNQSITIIQANLKDSFQIVIDKYLQKSLLNPVNIYFLANGKQINPSESVESYMSDLNKQNKKLNILVQILEGDNKEQVIITSKNIICPECKEPCRISFDNYKIKLYECDDGHITEDINIKDFENTQKINESKIICDKCKIKNKGNCQENDFFKCITCKQNLCLICRPNHDINHNVIKYTQKNYICQKHNESIINYCKQCKKNICFTCEDEHNNHELISMKELKPNIEENKKILKEMKNIIDSIDVTIKEIINILNDFNYTIKQYYEINNKIIENYDIKKRNYQILQNIKDIFNNNRIYNQLKNINNNKDIKGKINDIIDLYRNINIIHEKKEIQKINEIKIDNDCDEITIIYNRYSNVIKLFDSTFVNNNKSKCYITIDGEKKELCSILKLNENQKQRKTIEIKLHGIKNISNMSYMFYHCSSLFSLPDISKWDTKNVTDMSYMFGECRALISLPDISKWDTKNVTNMSSMFYNCTALISLPEISKWDTKNVTDMRNMFFSVKKSIVPNKFKNI